MQDDLHALMASKTDEQLLYVITVDRGYYVKEAIEVAEAEYKKRFPDVDIASAIKLAKIEIKERKSGYLNKDRTLETYTIAETLPKDSFISSDGRIDMATYWTRWFVCVIVQVGFVYMGYMDDDMAVFTSFMGRVLVTILLIIQGVKRMHDVDKSGWYILIPLYNLILLLTDGTIGSNRFGEDPKGRIPVTEN